MKNYRAELIFIIAVILLSIGGFWNIFFGTEANPDAYQIFHVITVLLWLSFLLGQLLIIKKKNHTLHRQLGIAIFLMGPLVFAHLVLLTIHSASKSAIVGKGDDLLVQNIIPTLRVGLIILLGFILRKDLKLHANLLMSSALVFMGIALFFVLLAFVPPFTMDGDEAFPRFEMAALTSTLICLAVGLFFFFKDKRNGWPWLLAVSIFFFIVFLDLMIAGTEIHIRFTELVGFMDQKYAFAAGFIGFLILLALSWRMNTKSGNKKLYNEKTIIGEG